jgi:mannose-6-phosphate isomerase-like protein (cupin superfamily)
MNSFNVYRMLEGRDTSAHSYEDFFASHLLSLGLSVWPAGGPDNQTPHAEDEVYYVVEGHGRISVGAEDDAVGPGSLVFVAAGVEHRFHDIEETLKVLVFWAPPHRRPHTS